MRILILGASGFIGSHLAKIASQNNHDVIALCRSGRVTGFQGSTQKWHMGERLPDDLFTNVDCVIHLAHDFSKKQGAETTIKSTTEIINQAFTANVRRQLYFSSFSAHHNAESTYGKTKFLIEQSISNIPNTTVVRPGLVIGNGGLYANIARAVRLSPFIPLPDAGKATTPVIEIEKLCHESLKLCQNTRGVSEANLFEAEHVPLRTLVTSIADRLNKRVIIIGIPSWVLIYCFKIASFLRLPLPVNEDNLTGFLANQSIPHKSTLIQ
ncbi:NAD(P)-dependent oxidoreductase [Arenicella sp. 4NH20-0111]|uniref:NAD-dependent epimerase/dehydratase family protein n=1 Tax=Arenicella sp. 4NH20-0111 TaxID=3127648 RepID=UPI00333FAEC4